MREILFRGKRCENGEWVEGFYAVKGEAYRRPEQHCICVSTLSSDCESSYFTDVVVIPETVGQYTGLTDKNGKRIFEGDIISFKMYSALGYLRCRIGVVKYCDRSAGFYVLATTGDAWSWCECEDIEVIGNIRDNPELMRSGEQDATD